MICCEKERDEKFGRGEWVKIGFGFGWFWFWGVALLDGVDGLRCPQVLRPGGDLGAG